MTGRALCLCLVLGACAARADRTETPRRRADAEFVRNASTWTLDGAEPIEVTDAAHFRALLRDPAPKSLMIDDARWSAKRHAILCTELESRQIRVKRLAIRVVSVARPMSEAVDCLARLPIEYLSLGAYSSAEHCIPLDIESLVRKLRDGSPRGLRGLALYGYEIDGGFRPVSAPGLEELDLYVSSANRATWKEERTAFFATLAASDLRGLRTLTIESGQSGWTAAQLQSLSSFSQVARFHLELETDAAAVAEVIAGMPRLEWARLPYAADDRVVAALAELRHLEVLEINGERMTADGLAGLARVASLRELTVRGSLSDAKLSQLAHITQLQRLHITGIELRTVMRASLEAFSKLTKLEVLDLAFTEVDPHALHHLGRLGALRSLAIRSPAPCETLAFLGELRRLESLELETEPRCLRSLGVLTALTRLVVHTGDAVTRGADLAPLVGIPLTTFALPYGGVVDDWAAIELAKIGTLRELDISRRGLTCRGVRALASLPLRRFGRAEDDHDWWLRHLDSCRKVGRT